VNDARTFEPRVVRTVPVRRLDAAAKAGADNKHSRRFERRKGSLAWRRVGPDPSGRWPSSGRRWPSGWSGPGGGRWRCAWRAAPAGRSGRPPAGRRIRSRAWRRTDRRDGRRPGSGVTRAAAARRNCAGELAEDPGPDVATMLIRVGDASTRSNRLAARPRRGRGMLVWAVDGARPPASRADAV